MKAQRLAELRVRDIRHLLVDEPSWVGPAVSIRAVMEKMIADLRTRWVYVVDDEHRLIGAISMNSIVEYLFPLEAIIEHSFPLYEVYFPKVGALTAHDLMDASTPRITEETSLADMADLLMQHQVNELPVVNDQGVLIGQVNVYEVIRAYLGADNDKARED